VELCIALTGSLIALSLFQKGKCKKNIQFQQGGIIFYPYVVPLLTLVKNQTKDIKGLFI
jgi:hypothetical protein